MNRYRICRLLFWPGVIAAAVLLATATAIVFLRP